MNIPNKWGGPGATQLRSSRFGIPYIITADKRRVRISAEGSSKTVIEPLEAGGRRRVIAAIPAHHLSFGLLGRLGLDVSNLFQINRAGLDYGIVYTANFEDLI